MDGLTSVGWVHVEDGRLLAVRTRGRDRFYLPGGKFEPGETAEQALVREVHEELGLTLTRPRPIFTVRARAHGLERPTDLTMHCFTADAVDGSVAKLQPQREIEEVAWLRIPDDPRAAPAVCEVLAELARRRRPTVTVRDAREDDLDAIAVVGARTWPPTYAFAGPDYVSDGLHRWWSAEALRRSLADTTMLVAEVVGTVVGVGNIDTRQTIPIIWKLYVLPDHQGSGAGSALLTAVLARVAPEVPAVRLEYVEGNEPAARFYARHGFVEVERQQGERPGWPGTVWVQRARPF